MSTTRKGGKKANKATRSGKAAAAKAGRRTKASATTGAKKAGAKKGPPGGGVDHPPVIITDGSATLRLHEPTYPGSGDTHASTNLRIDRLTSSRTHTDGTFICRSLAPNERVEIRVTCRTGSGGNERAFTIVGGNSTAAGNSPQVTFDHGVFPPGSHDSRGRRIFRNPSRNIISLEIFSPPGSGNRVHDCSVVKNKEDYIFTLFDH
jgi:hypothetical protein